MVHGVATHDRGKVIQSWGRIPEILKANGIKVFFGNTDSWATYESNAEILKTTIDAIVNETGSEKVNIIAHSKGGLDSRYFIWKYNYGNKVASLTTISTPHHGSEIADLLYEKNIVHTDFGKKIFLSFEKFYDDANPDIYNLLYQLTTEKMKEFNKIVVMDSNVYYQSIYSTMENPSDEPILSNTHRYIKRVSGDNDGVVSEHSARWGTNIIKLEGGISHVKIIDHKRRKTSKINIPDIYLNIVKELSQMGY